MADLLTAVSRYILMFYSIFVIKFVFLLVSLFFHGCRISRRPLERAELNNTTVRQIFDILILMQCMKKSLQDDDVWTHPQKKLKFFYLCIYVAHSVFSKWGKLCIMIFRNQYRIRYIAKNNFNVFSFFFEIFISTQFSPEVILYLKKFLKNKPQFFFILFNVAKTSTNCALLRSLQHSGKQPLIARLHFLAVGVIIVLVLHTMLSENCFECGYYYYQGTTVVKFLKCSIMIFFFG